MSLYGASFGDLSVDNMEVVLVEKLKSLDSQTPMSYLFSCLNNIARVMDTPLSPAQSGSLQAAASIISSYVSLCITNGDVFPLYRSLAKRASVVPPALEYLFSLVRVFSSLVGCILMLFL